MIIHPSVTLFFRFALDQITTYSERPFEDMDPSESGPIVIAMSD